MASTADPSQRCQGRTTWSKAVIWARSQRRYSSMSTNKLHRQAKAYLVPLDLQSETWPSIQRNSRHLFCARNVSVSENGLISLFLVFWIRKYLWCHDWVLQYLGRNCSIPVLQSLAVPLRNQKVHPCLWRKMFEVCSFINMNSSVILHVNKRWSHHNTAKITHSVQGSIWFRGLCEADGLWLSHFGHVSILLWSPTWSGFFSPYLVMYFVLYFLASVSINKNKKCLFLHSVFSNLVYDLN